MFFCPDQPDGPAHSRPLRAFAGVVLLGALIDELVPLDFVPAKTAGTSLGTPYPLSDMVEAGESEHFGPLKTRKLLKNRRAQKSKSAEIAFNWNVSGTRDFHRARQFREEDLASLLFRTWQIQPSSSGTTYTAPSGLGTYVPLSWPLRRLQSAKDELVNILVKRFGDLHHYLHGNHP